MGQCYLMGQSGGEVEVKHKNFKTAQHSTDLTGEGVHYTHYKFKIDNEVNMFSLKGYLLVTQHSMGWNVDTKRNIFDKENQISEWMYSSDFDGARTYTKNHVAFKDMLAARDDKEHRFFPLDYKTSGDFSVNYNETTNELEVDLYYYNHTNNDRTAQLEFDVYYV